MSSNDPNSSDYYIDKPESSSEDSKPGIISEVVGGVIDSLLHPSSSSDESASSPEEKLAQAIEEYRRSSR